MINNKSVDVRLELSKNFFKKLQRLDLIEECQWYEKANADAAVLYRALEKM